MRQRRLLVAVLIVALAAIGAGTTVALRGPGGPSSAPAGAGHDSAVANIGGFSISYPPRLEARRMELLEHRHRFLPAAHHGATYPKVRIGLASNRATRQRRCGRLVRDRGAAAHRRCGLAPQSGSDRPLGGHRTRDLRQGSRNSTTPRRSPPTPHRLPGRRRRCRRLRPSSRQKPGWAAKDAGQLVLHAVALTLAGVPE